MGFLSRKSKFAEPKVVEETHPIVEELEEMEEAVPEREARDVEGPTPSPTGPVAAGDPPPPAVA